MTINGTSEDHTDGLFDLDRVLSARVQHLHNAFDARKSIISDLQIRCLPARSSLAFLYFPGSCPLDSATFSRLGELFLLRVR